MNHLPYPSGARVIAEARQNGMRPVDVVLIVLAGHFDWSNPTVSADPKRRYRWDWLRGLPVVLLIDASTRIGNTLRDIDEQDPRQIDVIDCERKAGWLVNFTKPRVSTVRWPAAQVTDWLDGGTWHRQLHQLVSESRALSAEQFRTQQQHPEAIWN